MKYDFTSIIDRHGKDAIAVDGLVPGGHGPQPPKEGFDIIPMWVADMNFPTVPTITQAIAQRIQHPFFGYFATSDDYYNAIIHWQEQRNGVTGLTKECIGYENGVLGGVISALNVLCSKGDNVLLHSPTYIGFTGCLTNNGYHIVHSPLVKDEAGIYRMDLATGEVLDVIEAEPLALAVLGENVYYLDSADNLLYSYHTADGTILQAVEGVPMRSLRRVNTELRYVTQEDAEGLLSLN
jgi:bifunctional pyridoxal-dependent enzyme with beta-cystathionase and maltose regulon repressor activities